MQLLGQYSVKINIQTKGWCRWGPLYYLAKVLTGIKFKDGIEVRAIDQAAA